MILVSAPQVSYENEIAELVKVFFPDAEVIRGKNQEVEPDWDMLIECGYNEKKEKEDSFSFYAHLKAGTEEELRSYLEDKINTSDSYKKKRGIKNGLKGCVYNLLSSYTGKKPKWGILTGIRPTKLVHEMMDEGFTNESIEHELLNTYRIHGSKAELLLDTARVQRPFIVNEDNRTVSIYIHIPFCSTRCLYCSFPTDLIDRVAGKMGKYLDCLEQELSSILAEFQKKGLYIDTVYIGGGTPTVLEHKDLKRLLNIVKAHILDAYSVIEYTVEAGRPDSLDYEKLQLLKEYGVSRVSINPQSMNQKTLDLVGRSHTVEDIVTVYNQARQIGFDSINMDVIIGLPGEDGKDLYRTMEEIAELKPDNITMHTLAVKRASLLKETFNQYDPSRDGLAEEMAAICSTWIERLQMVPYYMYRQKYMLDHLENVGYAVPGKECLYNIHIMEEKRSIWAFGAGASSKIYYPAEDRIERIANVKNLNEYIKRIEEMIDRKQKVLNID